MRINNWSGGLFTRRDSTLIPLTTGVVYHNINPESEVLKGEYAPIITNTPVANPWAIEGYGGIVSSPSATSYVKYKEHVFYTDSSGNLVAKQGSQTTIVGINYPTVVPSVSLEQRLVTDPLITSSSTTQITAEDYGSAIFNIPETLEGEYRYVYTYYDSSSGAESRPSPMSEAIQYPENGLQPDASSRIYTIKVQVSLPTQPNVDKIRIYRVGGNLTSFSLVAELNSTVSTLYDASTDFSIAGNTVLDSYYNYPPPKNLKYLTLHNAIIFGAREDKLYFSAVGNPHAWDIYNTIDFDDVITGIGSTAHGLLVFTKYKTYIITGTSGGTFAKHILNNEQGCVNHYTISNLDNSLVWVSTDGVCISNGGTISVFTIQYLGKFQPDTINGVAHDRMYVLSCVDKIYVIDFRYSPCVRTLDPIDVPVWVYQDNFVYRDSVTGLITFLFRENPNLRPFTFKSGVIGFDGVTGYKTLKDVYISCKGKFNFKLYAYTEYTKVLLLDTNINVSNMSVLQLKTKGVYMSYAVEYEVSGVGIIYEIDIKGVTRNAD